MFPVLFKIFGFDIHSFGVMVALGFLAGYLWMRYAAERMEEDADRIADLSLWVLLAGIVGARLLFVLVHRNEYVDHPLEALMIWKGGLVLYGGILGAMLTGFLIIKRRGMSFHRTADIVMPCLMLGLAIGRWGCLMVGDCYGRVASDLPWAIRFPNIAGSMMPHTLIDRPLHPTQIYMSLNAFLLFLILTVVLRRRRFEGQVFYIGLMLYAISRSIIECYRGDNLERGYFGPLSTSQWISVVIALLALWRYVVARRNASVVVGAAAFSTPIPSPREDVPEGDTRER